MLASLSAPGMAFFLALAFLIAPLPFVLGAVFPLLLRLAASQGEALPRRTGLIYLANSAGAFLGALLPDWSLSP